MAKDPKTPKDWPYVDADGKPIPPEHFDNDQRFTGDVKTEPGGAYDALKERDKAKKK